MADLSNPATSDLVSLYNQPSVPPDYAASLNTVAPTITDKIAQSQTPGESWVDTLARILPSVLATVQQKDLLDVQVQRAKQGLPPLDVSQYTSGVSVGLSQQTKDLLLYGGLAAMGVWLVTSLHKHR